MIQDAFKRAAQGLLIAAAQRVFIIHEPTMSMGQWVTIRGARRRVRE
jgi:hypothetical protein